MARVAVTDPAILAMLNGDGGAGAQGPGVRPAAQARRVPVTDPAVLAQLEAPEAAPAAPAGGFGRALQLGGRAAAEGFGGTLDAVQKLGAGPGGQVPVATRNAAGQTMNATPTELTNMELGGMLGLTPDQSRDLPSIIRAGLTKLGIAEPESGDERRASAAIRGVTGSIGTGGARPVLAGIAGAAGALGTQEAVERGGGTGTQIAAGIGGGMAGGGVAQVGASAARGVGAALAPAVESGRRAIAGNILREAAVDPDAALANLSASRPAAATSRASATGRVNTATGSARAAPGPEDIPGQRLTTAEATRDPGLAFLQARMRAIQPVAINQTMSAQNAARNALLDSIADGGVPAKIAERVARRETVTQTLRDNAFKESAGKRVPTERVLADIDTLLDNPENAGESVQKALGTFRSQLANGKPTRSVVDGIEVEESNPITDARALYAVRKEINRVLEGRYVGSEESILRYAGGQLKKVRDSIDTAISEVAPSWKGYLTKYAQLSRPIERAEKLGEIREKTSLAAQDLGTGTERISQAKWKNVVAKAMPELEQTFTKQQLRKLNMITNDLDRGAAVEQAGKTPQSDTAANLVAKGQVTAAHVLGRVLGSRSAKEPGAVLGTLAGRPLAWLYKIPDEQIRELVAQAMSDPDLASDLLARGTPQNIQKIADTLRQNAVASGIVTAEQSGL